MLLVDTDHRVELTELKDSNGNLLSGATVTATLFERDRTTAVAGQTWPLTLTEEDPGQYGGIIDDAVEIQVGERFELQMVAESGSLKRTWWEPLVATRGGFP